MVRPPPKDLNKGTRLKEDGRSYRVLTHERNKSLCLETITFIYESNTRERTEAVAKVLMAEWRRVGETRASRSLEDDYMGSNLTWINCAP